MLTGLVIGNADAAVLNQVLNRDCPEDLVKALNRQGLVQKEIQYKTKTGKIATRKQWVRAGEKPKSDRPHWTRDGTSEEAKKQISDMLASGRTREELIKEFKAKGVTWPEHDKPSTNWLRASIAINKYLTLQASLPKTASELKTQLADLRGEVSSLDSQISTLQPKVKEVYDKTKDSFLKDPANAHLDRSERGHLARVAARKASKNYLGFNDLQKKREGLLERVKVLEELEQSGTLNTTPEQSLQEQIDRLESELTPIQHQINVLEDGADEAYEDAYDKVFNSLKDDQFMTLMEKRDLAWDAGMKAKNEYKGFGKLFERRWEITKELEKLRAELAELTMDTHTRKKIKLEAELDSVKSQIDSIKPGADEAYEGAYQETYDKHMKELKDSSFNKMRAIYAGKKAGEEAKNNYKGYGDLVKKKDELEVEIRVLDAKARAFKLATKPEINRSSQIYKSLSPEIVDDISSLVDSAHPSARRTWMAYEERLKVLSYKYTKDTAHFDPEGQGINMNLYKDIEDVKKAEKWDADHPDSDRKHVERHDSRFNTFFHEFYHNIDCSVDLARSGKYDHGFYHDGYYSERYKGGLFARTIREEVSEMVEARWEERKRIAKDCTEIISVSNLDKLFSAGMINRYKYDELMEYENHADDPTDDWWITKVSDPSTVSTPEKRRQLAARAHLQNQFAFADISEKTKKENAYNDIANELRKTPGRDRSGISDVFDGATHGRARAGYGHRRSYWYDKSHDFLALEAFANMGAAWMDRENKQMEVFKKWLPKSSAVFEDMLKDISGEV